MDQDSVENGSSTSQGEKNSGDYDYEDHHVFHSQKSSCSRTCWPKNGLLVISIISVSANLLFVVLSFLFIQRHFKEMTKPQANSLSDVSPYCRLIYKRGHEQMY